MKTSTVGILSFICALLGLLLVLLKCLCWFLFEREALVFIFLLWWYPTLFICGLALILGIIAIVTIKLKKGALGGIKLVKGGICLVLLCFLGLYILKLKSTPILHIERCRAVLRNLIEDMDAYAQDNNDKWPPGPTWCDVLHDKYVRSLHQFICPADNVGPCSYAINEHAVNLGTSIPVNMVLLFESKPGWNQVGGPEMLNTTNHNGRGCIVCFGDYHNEFVPTSRLGDLQWTANENKKN